MGRTERHRQRKRRIERNSDDYFHELLEWMKIASGGGWTPPKTLQLHVFELDSGFQLRGLKTTAPIRRGDNLIQVPSQLVVTRDVALTHLPPDMNRLILRNPDTFTSHQILAMFLVHQS